MKKNIVLVLFSLFAVSSILAQANAPWNTNNYKKLIMTSNSAYVKDDIKKRKPIVLPPIREEDVAWSILVWRVIDVREKMNQNLYYPQTSTEERQNLMTVLLEGVKSQGLTAYDVNNDEFTTPISYEDIMKKLDAGEQVIQVRNQMTGELEDKVIQSESTGTAEVLQFMLKEEWFFDKNSSTLQVRILGVCPIRVYEKQGNFVQNLDEAEDGSTVDYEENFVEPKIRTKLFWVYFPEARPLLATKEVFNRRNDSQRLSFDQLFIKRYFSSYIAQASNLYDNRAVSDYATGLEQIRESERIKEKILKLENDLWEY